MPGAHENRRYVKLENGETLGRASYPPAPVLGARNRGYPQVAQSTVEMLIIQNPQSAVFSLGGTLARPLETPYIPNCAERAARVGRSSTEGLYEEVRKGRDRKVSRC
jgi:hypothetical protein